MRLNQHQKELFIEFPPFIQGSFTIIKSDLNSYRNSVRTELRNQPAHHTESNAMQRFFYEEALKTKWKNLIGSRNPFFHSTGVFLLFDETNLKEGSNKRNQKSEEFFKISHSF